jgi:hypothetical protein
MNSASKYNALIIAVKVGVVFVSSFEKRRQP